MEVHLLLTQHQAEKTRCGREGRGAALRWAWQRCAPPGRIESLSLMLCRQKLDFYLALAGVMAASMSLDSTSRCPSRPYDLLNLRRSLFTSASLISSRRNGRHR